MSIDTNTFCWHGISTNIETGVPFYKNALGWNVASHDDGTMFLAPAGAVAHIQPPGDAPPAWCSFLAVSDLDASTAAAGIAGSVLFPPTDLAIGRFSVVCTPSGAVFGLYEPTPDDDPAASGPGGVRAIDLQTPTPEADAEWMTEVFGLTAQPQSDHTVLATGATPVARVRATTDHPAVLAWVEATDLDATIDAVTAHGGTVLAPAHPDNELGQVAIVADPSGAVFGLVQPTA